MGREGHAIETLRAENERLRAALEVFMNEAHNQGTEAYYKGKAALGEQGRGAVDGANMNMLDGPGPKLSEALGRELVLRAEVERLMAYALHMRDRYETYRAHHGTGGTYPHPTSVALLDAALGEQGKG
jgi:hypothetical protein